MGTDLGGAVDIVQITNYYPFGLVMSQTNESYSPTYRKNKYLYNGKELQDDKMTSEALDWYDYDARFYDAQIGLWTTPDPSAELYRKWSPYNYAVNNPIRFIDPDGMDVIPGGGQYGSDLYTGIDAQNLFRELQAQYRSNDQDKQDDKKKGDDKDKKKKSDDPKKADDTKKASYALPLPWTLEIEEFIGASFLRLISVAGILITIPGDTPIDHQVNYIPPPRDLPGFPSATKVRPKTGRARWTLPNGDIAEWDSQHGDVEVYDKTGKNHKGSFDPKTGKQNKPPKKGQTTEK